MDAVSYELCESLEFHSKGGDAQLNQNPGMGGGQGSGSLAPVSQHAVYLPEIFAPALIPDTGRCW